MIPIEHAIWTTSEIGEYLGIVPKRVMDRFVALPDFPKPFRLPTADGRSTHYRWYAKDVIEWVANNKMAA